MNDIAHQRMVQAALKKKFGSHRRLLGILEHGEVEYMTTYKTTEVAEIIGIHPNTVRLYEKLNLISTPERTAGGYRVFTDLHIGQCRLIRLAFQVEVLQNGLRKKIAEMVKAAAAEDFDGAIVIINDYLVQIKQERSNAEEAIEIVKQLLSDTTRPHTQCLKRKEVSEMLGISMDALRNWEMNGLLSVKRKENGYRVYTDDDIRRLKIIRSLRCANYSLEAILRLLQLLTKNPNTDIRSALNTPKQSDDIITACDSVAIRCFRCAMPGTDNSSYTCLGIMIFSQFC